MVNDGPEPAASLHFDGARAYAHVQYQVDLGPRLPGTLAHTAALEWVQASLEAAGWATEVQQRELAGKPVRNLIARRGAGSPWLILGAHYDTRILADRDADFQKRSQPVPGANDGALGVAVLLELARVLPEQINGQVWLVFFDAEDNGRIEDWDWILGSRAFVEALEEKPDATVILDMVGDADLQFLLERYSDPALAAEMWQAAAQLGYDKVFLSQPGKAILDDHIPFLQAGIPAVDIIDIDYPYWHTTQDTVDKVSAESLAIVGEVMQAWLAGRLNLVLE
jgi:Zn-dependent M28 family amino/carboxypeptidase